MKEMYSKALVLGRKDVGEYDGLVSLFTKNFGKITAFAKSVRKPTSKLSAHLQPLVFIKVRLIEKSVSGSWGIIDCLRDDDFLAYKTYLRDDLVPIIKFLDTALFEFQADLRLWNFLEGVFIHYYGYSEVVRNLLKIMGFEVEGANCFFCGASNVIAFSDKYQAFLCRSCSLKFSLSGLLYLKYGS